MIHPLIRRRMIERLGLTESQAISLDRIYGDCTELPSSNAELLGHLPVGTSMADLQTAYAEAEAELRLLTNHHSTRAKGVEAMTFQLNHRPVRTPIVKEVDPDFFDKNGIKLTELATPKALAMTVPPSFSIKTGMSGAKDQGSGGHCATFAITGCLDYFYGKRDLSESCLTHEAEKRHGDCTEGLALAHAFDVATNPGMVDQEFWANDPRQTCWASPPDVTGKPRYKFAANRLVFYRTSAAVLNVMKEQLRNGINNPFVNSPAQYSVDVFDDPNLPQPQNFVRLLKAALVNAGTPVAVSIPVWWESDGHFEAGWEDGPDIHMPTPVLLQNFLDNKSPPNVSGWHAVAVCGYDDSRARFEFKNSWHTWWGDKGFGTLPYDYITAYAREAMHGWV